MSTRLVGGVHRDVTGRVDEPLRFYLVVDRGLKSGALDQVDVGEAEIIALVREGAQALDMLRRDREGER